MHTTEERRSATRLLFNPRVYCELREDGREFCGTIRDISMHGLFLTTDNEISATGPCDVQIVLEGNHSELEINNLAGTIVRNDEQGIAICFDNKLEWFSIVPIYFKKLAA